MGINVLPLTVLHQLFSAFTKEQRSLLESKPLTTGALPLLDETATELHQLFKADARTRAIQGLTRAMAEADAEHDSQYSLLWQVLTTERVYWRSRGPAHAEHVEALDALMAVLCRNGQGQINRSYLQEASEAQLLFDGLNEQQIQMLEAILYRGTTALAIAKRWIAAAERLGDLVRQRAALMGEDTPDDPTTNGRDIRSKALTRLSLFLEMLGQAGFSDQALALLRNPVTSAVQEHKKRLAKKNSPDDVIVDPPSEPAPAPEGDVALPDDSAHPPAEGAAMSEADEMAHLSPDDTQALDLPPPLPLTPEPTATTRHASGGRAAAGL